MGDILSVRLDDELEKRLAYVMKRRKIVDRSAYIRQLIDRSLSEDLLDYLAGEVSGKRISVWRAASVAGISLRAMMGELARRNVWSYDEESLREDLMFVEGK
jgi:predicted HTH domain antitoxin